MKATPRRVSIGVAYWTTAATLAALVWRCEAHDALQVWRLRWHGRENPLGIVQSEPELSWAIASEQRGQKQTAYQVLVASERRDLAPGRADLWDSGKVISAAQTHIKYAGKAPKSRERGYWTVRAWDKDDKPSPWAKPAWWESGPYDEEMEGEWIGRNVSETEPPERLDRAVTYLRKTFSLPSSVRTGRLYASALGAYELYLNGKAVSDDVLAPGYTDFERRNLFQSYDVTQLLDRGDNALGAILARGFCNHVLGTAHGTCDSKPARLLARLEVTLDDGSTHEIQTDDTWKANDGPIVSSHVHDGESYDARLEKPDWAAAAFDDHEWGNAVAYKEELERSVISDPGPPMRAARELRAVAVTEPEPNVFVFDLGQNIVGRARVRLEGDAGTTATLRFAEAVKADGSLRTAHSSSASDHFTLRGKGVEIWEPHFTVHGFRYVEISGLKENPGIGAVTGRVIHSAMTETGHLETSNALLNRLFSNIVWSQRGAFLNVPMSGRERLGALAEAQVFVRTACLNLDVQHFFRKWDADIRDARQGSSHSAAAPRIADHLGGFGAMDADVVIPWAMYECYDDQSLMSSSLALITQRIETLRAQNPDLLAATGGNAEWSDRLESLDPTDPVLAKTAYFAHGADLLSRMYRVLGLADKADEYQHLFEAIREAFKRAFVSPTDGRLKSDTATAYALAIRFGLIPEALLQQTGGRLVETIERHGERITTGIFGSAELLPALSAIGRDDVAYRLLMNESCPSWLCSVKNGATTIWERWEGPNADSALASSESNSLNYYALGAVGAWMYSAIGGIELDPTAPAGKHVLIHPRPGGGLTYANARFDSNYGRIETRWKLDPSVFRLSVSIPAGTTATVTLPYGTAATESGNPIGRSPFVELVAGSTSQIVVEIEAGTYDFVAPIR